MLCPSCRDANTVVVDSRGDRRTRRCKECDHRFVTIEALDVSNLRVEKRNGKRVHFNRDRLAASIRKAAVRGLPTTEVSELVNLITAKLFSSKELFFSNDREVLPLDHVTTRQVGDAVMQVLDTKTRYRATRLRYALLFGLSNGDFTDAAGFLGWLGPAGTEGELPKLPTLVAKRSGDVVPFEPVKLFNSIKFAVKKRPVEDLEGETLNQQLIERITYLVLQELRGQNSVSSGQLSTETMRVLTRSTDKKLAALIDDGARELAYLRVASSAKDFARADDFAAEAHYLLARRKGS